MNIRKRGAIFPFEITFQQKGYIIQVNIIGLANVTSSETPLDQIAGWIHGAGISRIQSTSFLTYMSGQITN